MGNGGYIAQFSENSCVEFPNPVTLDRNSLIMGNDHGSQAFFGMQFPDHVENRIPRAMVQIARWLVGQE